MMQPRSIVFVFPLVSALACAQASGPTDASAEADSGAAAPDAGQTTADSGGTAMDTGVGTPDGGAMNPDAGQILRDAGPGVSPVVGGCSIFPPDHIFNTPIDDLPPDPNSAAYLSTIGRHNFHLDLGSSVDITAADYYGIPYNVVHGDSIPWVPVAFHTVDVNLDWDPTDEADCASGNAHTLVSPCTAARAASPIFPIPAMPLVEGGIDRDPSQPYGDHHILMLDADHCRLWELYHAYPTAAGWDIFGSAYFDLSSNALRPAGWTSADAAGFPILALLLRADEASAGAIHHALRFTIGSDKIRTSYIWPGRHLTNNGTSMTDLPPMGQLFRVKASFNIPGNFNTQARAIVQAMKTYGFYLADGGSDMYVTGEPSAAWLDQTITQVQSISNAEVEAVDISPIMNRPGFNVDSARVPPR